MKKNRQEPTYKRYITGSIKRFDERNTGYSRADRGEIIGPNEALMHGLEIKYGKEETGFLREDYALNLAGRAIDTLVRKKVYSRDVFPRRWSIPEEKKVTHIDPAKMSEKIKRVGKWFGASMVGISELNRLWLYSHWGDHGAKLAETFTPGDPVELPEEYRYVIVFAIEMDYFDIQRSPAVTPTIDLGYSKMAFTATSVAEFIRILGFQAIPSGNDTALCVPLAIDAGLGEAGRNGLLITEEFGPRVRISKVFTDLPLVHDKPIEFGVREFCETCKRCAEECPGRALPFGEPTIEPNNISNAGGAYKWYCDNEKCQAFWVRNLGACLNCVRVCPFNKPEGWIHDAARFIVRNASWIDPVLLRMNKAFGYGKRAKGDSCWE